MLQYKPHIPYNVTSVYLAYLNKNNFPSTVFPGQIADKHTHVCS